MALGQTLETQLLAVMAKMADAVSDPKRLKALQDATENMEAAARRAGVGKDLDKARALASKMVADAEATKAAALAELKGARQEARDIKRAVEDAISAERAGLASKVAEANDLIEANKKTEKALAEQQGTLSRRDISLDERERVLDEREKELDAWAGRLKQAAKR